MHRMELHYGSSEGNDMHAALLCIPFQQMEKMGIRRGSSNVHGIDHLDGDEQFIIRLFIKGKAGSIDTREQG